LAARTARFSSFAATCANFPRAKKSSFATSAALMWKCRLQTLRLVRACRQCALLLRVLTHRCYAVADGRLMTPDAAYKAIETLLPGGYTAGQPGRFLELWGHPELRRPGWTHVCC